MSRSISPLRNWKLKAALQWGLSLVPGGHRANYLLQTRITKNLPVSDAKLEEAIELGRHHTARLEDSGLHLGSARFYEFGAGWDLAMPLVLWSLGVDHQVVVDLRPLRRPELVANVARRLSERTAELDRSLPEPTSSNIDQWLASLGIDYRAPCDARSTGLATGSIDAITSTNTMEHIPPKDLRSILRECTRVLRPGGAMSFQIDYQDHWSYFDPSIDVFHFLRYEDRRWRLLNPPLHFQNRLRHQDYLELFEEAGLVVIDAEESGGGPDDMDLVRRQPLASHFASQPPEALAVRGSRVLLEPVTR